jgi:hypothetical protein
MTINTTTAPATIINVVDIRGRLGRAFFYNTGNPSTDWAEGSVLVNWGTRYFDAHITKDDCERVVNGDFSTITDDIFEVDEDEDEE